MPTQRTLNDAYPVAIEGLEMISKHKRFGGRDVASVKEYGVNEAEKEKIYNETTCDTVLLVYQHQQDIAQRAYYLVHFRKGEK